MIACSGGERDYLSYNEAEKLYMKGESCEALMLLERLEEDNSSFLKPFVLDGRINLFLGNYDAAENKLEYVLEKNPLDFEAVRWLSWVYLRKDETEKCIRLLKSALKKYPEEPRLLLLYGNAEKKGGNHTEAAEAYRRAFLFEEELAMAHFEYALLCSGFALEEKYRCELERAALLAGENHELSEAIRKLYE